MREMRSHCYDNGRDMKKTMAPKSELWTSTHDYFGALQ